MHVGCALATVTPRWATCGCSAFELLGLLTDVRNRLLSR